MCLFLKIDVTTLHFDFEIIASRIGNKKYGSLANNQKVKMNSQ